MDRHRVYRQTVIKHNEVNASKIFIIINNVQRLQKNKFIEPS